MKNDLYEFNVDEVERWMKRNGRGAREKLAVAARISSGTIDKLRRTRNLPSGRNLISLSKALGVPLTKLIVEKPDLKSA